MCQSNWEVLAHNKVGSILNSKDSEFLMIAIGTVMVKFTREETRIFSNALIGMRKQLQCPKNCCHKAFINTPVNNLFIALNKEELENSIDLLQMGLLELEVRELLRF